jgi:predicted alpha/beta superfamily hydrolase
MKSLFLSLLMTIITVVVASAQVTFTVQSLPAYTPPQDSIYIAGNFNGWEPGLPAYMLHKNAQGKWSITLPAQASGTVLKFKFTRGSWATVEKGAGGEEIPDRSYTFGTADSVDITIANWAGGGGGSTSTAAENVKIISTDFYMPQLNRTRRIWMYFPPDYETSGLSYPVLYMHDGQNLFDASTAFSGEWEVDETLNSLVQQGKHVPLVVGIDNGGGDRIDEYTPWANSQYGGGDGEKYMQFIVETLKPYIDQNYRTLANRENTGILGSSLGGLISHYGSLKYQDIFSKAGLFSPSYWFSDSIWVFTHNTIKQEDLRFYQLCGNSESAGMVGDMQRMNDTLMSIGFSQEKVFNKIVAGGQHNEKLWREAFSDAYIWLFNEYVNGIDEVSVSNTIQCFPNPADDFITFDPDNKMIFDTIQIIDMKGIRLISIYKPIHNSIDIRQLLPGTYIIRCISKGTFSEGKFIKK